MGLYKDIKARALSIVQHGDEEYIIMEFNHVYKKVVLFRCNVVGDIIDMKQRGEYFPLITDNYYGHAVRIYSDGMKRREEWIRKPIEYIDDFKVIYEH